MLTVSPLIPAWATSPLNVMLWLSIGVFPCLKLLSNSRASSFEKVGSNSFWISSLNVLVDGNNK